MAISSIGVGSNLPLGDLLESLRKSENQALNLIKFQQTSAENRFSAYGTLKSTIEALKKTSDALGKAETFGALKTSANGDAFTAVATSSAVAAEYSIKITDLASSQTLVAAGQADRATTIAGEGDTGPIDIEIALGNDSKKTITINKEDTSIDGIMKAINNDPELGVSATVINDGLESPFRLVLTAKATGTKAAVTSITVTGSPNLQGAIGYNSDDGNLFEQTAAENAKLTVNGLAIVSQSNTIRDVLDGVTLTLSKKTTEPTILSIARDDAVTSAAINAFVTAYNKLQGTVNSLTSFNVEQKSQSALTGDSLTRSIQSRIRGTLNVDESSGPIRTLAQLGITTNPNNGMLEVNTSKLNAALADNMIDVQKLFAAESGISATLGAVADTFIKSGGLINNATDSIATIRKTLQRQYDATSDRIDQKMETYRRQFTALDSMVAQMNSVSTYLTQQLSMLGNISNSK
ncbi:flagellar hook-associated protein 2 [Candidimonas sp. SYP-B2681]|uniref:flagellar filament capping protein FliD n=1 Tax=Candidimonas sp. SYP-B2681 TaxID=2497686 RepID=UPI000F87EB9A|nr:flagellar filament capping protein FliD [Candidimonas sp. SYP-B2681]RTZ47571.1 flagellar hook-associated protein 2 [Candidimonas sp. SYP-B2681]